MEDKLDESEVNWLESLEEELIKQDFLFETELVPLMAPQLAPTEPQSELPKEELVNLLVSKVYSGPTIGDVESALSLSCSSKKLGDGGGGGGQHRSRLISGLAEKGWSSTKMENKYILRIRTCVDGVADDGYKWRKYGQKIIKNSPNTRSYYRCTNPRCNAKKQVEKSTEDPNTVMVTYEGLHLHYTYSHILLSQKHDKHAANLNAVKKPKIQESEGQQHKQPMAHLPQSPQKREQTHHKKILTAEESRQECSLKDILLENPSLREKSVENGLLTDAQRTQGMLEDVVPLMVRKPCSSDTPLNEPCYSSQESSPTHDTSLLLSPSSSLIDIGILSSIW